MEKQLTQQEIEQLEKERYEEALKRNPPLYIDKLEPQPKEVIFSSLSDGDKFQLLTRYLNDLCAFSKSALQIVADLHVEVSLIAEKMGIDLTAEKNRIADEIREKQEKQLEEIKRRIQEKN